MADEEEPIETPHTAVSINEGEEDRKPLITKKDALPEGDATSLRGATRAHPVVPADAAGFDTGRVLKLARTESWLSILGHYIPRCAPRRTLLSRRRSS